MNNNFLKKKMRLLRSSEFSFVFQKPNIITKSGITVLSRPNQLGFPRIGLSISKKYIKYAHERNRIKRYVRETFRMNQHNLLSSDFVLTVRSKKIIYLKNNNLIEELKNLWSLHQ